METCTTTNIYLNNETNLLFQIQDLILVTAMHFLVFWVYHVLFVLELHMFLKNNKIIFMILKLIN